MREKKNPLPLSSWERLGYFIVTLPEPPNFFNFSVSKALHCRPNCVTNVLWGQSKINGPTSYYGYAPPYPLKLVSHWDATISRLVGDKVCDINMTFCHFSHCGHTGLCDHNIYLFNYIDDTGTTVVRHSRECLTTVVRHSCERPTTVVRHLCECLTTFLQILICFISRN